MTTRADGGYDVRYFSPEAEVPFCGHATIATAVALAERDGAGPLTFHTQAGRSRSRPRARTAPVTATLTSVAPHVEPGPRPARRSARRAGLEHRGARPRAPAAVAYAGARHLILPPARASASPISTTTSTALKATHAAPRSRRPSISSTGGPHHVPRPQPVPGRRRRRGPGDRRGRRGVRRLPARRWASSPPATVTLHQGDDMGRPSLLRSTSTAERPEIRVTGRAVAM